MSEESWHLSKSVPITIVVTAFLQTIAISWFLATLWNDVDNNKEKIFRTELKVESLNTAVVNQSILLARIDENLKVIKDALEKSK
jgi:hypothetical protein